MRLLPLALLLAAGGLMAADSDEPAVTQIKQSFIPVSVETAVGTTVVFTNSDDVNHNLYSVGPDGKKIDYGIDKPGETTSVKVDSAGVWTVRCNIHPRMKMIITAKAGAPPAAAAPPT